MQNRLVKFLNVSLITVLFMFNGLFSTAQADEETPNYSIEVIIFETFALKSWTEEYWPEEIETPDIENALDLQGLLNGSVDSGKLNVKAQANELQAEAAKLTPQKGYRILYHQTWSQDTFDDQTMPKLIIDNSNQDGAGSLVNGTVKLYKSRYAHVDFDLEFERRIPDRVKEDFIQNQKLTGPEDIVPETWHFKIKESRKIRPNQLHYIDHPMFGILVQMRYNGPASSSTPN
ncbi:CsiV family protein [Thiomicrorhabdus sp.]|uniref:CsiV family protein n=1 Tax=Thiomicrorhabdus sp. TaxID=2039724 RepID=UPI0035657414